MDVFKIKGMWGAELLACKLLFSFAQLHINVTCSAACAHFPSAVKLQIFVSGFDAERRSESEVLLFSSFILQEKSDQRNADWSEEMILVLNKF